MNRAQQITAIFGAIQRLTTCPSVFILGPSRIESICRNRAMAAGLMRELLSMTAVEIAGALNLDSHSTVLDLLKRCKKKRELRAEVAMLAAELRPVFEPEEELLLD